MSTRPNNKWKPAAKCEQCLTHNPDIGKPTEEVLKRNKKITKFQNARRNGQNPNVKDIVIYTA